MHGDAWRCSLVVSAAGVIAGRGGDGRERREGDPTRVGGAWGRGVEAVESMVMMHSTAGLV